MGKIYRPELKTNDNPVIMAGFKKMHPDTTWINMRRASVSQRYLSEYLIVSLVSLNRSQR